MAGTPGAWKRTSYGRMAERHIAGTILMAGYWLVQPYRPGARVRPHQRCADFGEVIARVRRFRTTNTDPENRLRVYVPSHATEDERRRTVKLGVEAI